MSEDDATGLRPEPRRAERPGWHTLAQASPPAPDRGDARLEGEVRQSWDGGGIIDMRLTARVPIERWTVEVDVGGTVVNIWNARVIAREGGRYVLGPRDYNEAIPAGTTVELGVEVDGRVRFEPLELVAHTSSGVAVGAAGTRAADLDAADRGATPEAGAGRDFPEPVEDLPPPSAPPVAGPPAHRPQVTVTAEGAREPPGVGEGLPRDSFAPGPLSVRGSRIVDSEGERAPIFGVNWFGSETEIFVPHGLWARNWRELMDEVKGLGFNVLRIPFSGELVASGGGTPGGIDYGLNPDLEGLDGLQVLDAVVAYAEVIGLRILLDYHRGTPGGGPNENGLWFGAGRSEADVIAEWQAIAQRYAGSPAVFGADLVNEPFMATWGDGSATDWAAAAGRIGDAVQAIAPHWLIVVEGVASHGGETYWWGGNLRGAREHPVDLDVPGKLVYSAHDYPASVHPQDWFFDGSDLVDTFRANWGFLVEEGIAPVLIGEWGSRLESAGDRRWADALAGYLDGNDIPWIWWALNPNSEDTGGVLADDWTTVRAPVAELLDPFLSRTRPAVPLGEDMSTGAEALFTVALAAPAQEEIVLPYATVDGTAVAGADYAASAGTLRFARGETAKTVAVPILPDAIAEGEEVFILVVGGGGDAPLSASASIADSDAGSQEGGLLSPEEPVSGADGRSARTRAHAAEPAVRDVAVPVQQGARDAGVEVPAALAAAGGVPHHVPEDPVTTELAGSGVRPEAKASAQARAAGNVPNAARPGDAGQHAAEDPPAPARTEADGGAQARVSVVVHGAAAGHPDRHALPNESSGAEDLRDEVWEIVLQAGFAPQAAPDGGAPDGPSGQGEPVGVGFPGDDGAIALAAVLGASDLSILAQ